MLHMTFNLIDFADLALPDRDRLASGTVAIIPGTLGHTYKFWDNPAPPSA